MNIISGWQRREYTQMGIWPGAEHYRRRYEYCAEYVTIMKELWATGRSDFKGDVLPDGRLPLPADADREDPDHLRRAERRRHAVRGADTPTTISAPASAINEPTRGGAERRPAGRRDAGDRAAIAARWCCRWSSPTRPTPRRWRSGSTTRPAPMSRRWPIATRRPRTTRTRIRIRRRNKRRTLGIDKLPTNQGVLVGSYASGRAHAGRAWRGAGRAAA